MHRRNPANSQKWTVQALTHNINDAPVPEKTNGSTKNPKALIGETQNQPPEKQPAAISSRKTIHPSVKVNMCRQAGDEWMREPKHGEG